MAHKLSKMDVQSMIEDKLMEERIEAKNRAWEKMEENKIKTKDEHGNQLPRSDS